jgi:hypothetical protein
MKNQEIGGYLNLNESFEQVFGSDMVNLNETRILDYIDPNNPNSKENYDDMLSKIGKVITFDRFMMLTDKVIGLLSEKEKHDDLFGEDSYDRSSFGGGGERRNFGKQVAKSDFFERFSKVLPFLNKGEYTDLKVFLFVEIGNFFVEEFSNVKE